MKATATPSPFASAQGFTIAVTGGIEPYEFTPAPSPPNPPGVVILLGPPVGVMVPVSTPPGTTVTVIVTDSSMPPQTVPVSDTTR